MKTFTVPMVVRVDGPHLDETLERISRLVRDAGVDCRFTRQRFDGDVRLYDRQRRIVVECSCCGDEDCDCPCVEEEDLPAYEFRCHAVGCTATGTVTRTVEGLPVLCREHALQVLVEDHGWQIGDRGVQRGKTYCPNHVERTDL